MFGWQKWVGVVLGLAVGSAILALVGGNHGKKVPPTGPILSECDGHLRELVIHYEPSAKEIVTNVYRDFLGALDSDVTVRVVCPARAAFDELAASVGSVRCKLVPIPVNHAMTTWSRDRWVALAPAGRGTPATILSPLGEAADEVWPARAGDEQVGMDIARALTPSVLARRSNFYFDGGDFLADGENVFVVPRLLPRNLQHTVASREEFLSSLAAQLKRRVILLDEAPDHHAAMFMISIGQRTMLVGDPSLGQKFAPALASNNVAGAGFESMNLPGGADFTPETQHLFDAVAAQCAAAGYKVIRMPVVPARDGRSYLTYVNVLLDQQPGHRIVYLPFYRGVEQMNAAARAEWESLGFEVRPVDCSSTFRHFGCLHCLVNVLSRS